MNKSSQDGPVNLPPGQRLFLLFVFAATGLLIYSNSLNGEFVSDDYSFFADNPAIRDLKEIKGIFLSFPTRFFGMLSFALNYHLGRLEPWGYHLVNIVFHVINSILVLFFALLLYQTPKLRRDLPPGPAFRLAFFSGLIFLAHPLQTQAVSFVTQRVAELGALFYLSAVVFYLAARLRGPESLLVAARLSMLGGVFSKELVVTVPAALLLVEVTGWGSLRGRIKEVAARIAPFVLIAGILPLVLLQEHPGSVAGLKGQISEQAFDGRYGLTELNALRTYLRLFFLPVNQRHEYDYPLARAVGEPGVLFSLALLAGLFILACRQFPQRRCLSFAVFWFFIATSVEVIVVSIVNRAVIYEHWAYLAMAGFALFVPAAVAGLIKNERRLPYALLPYFFILCLATYQRNEVWRTEIGFWQDVLKKSPDKFEVYLGAGSAYARKGFDEEAFDLYQQGIETFGRRRRQTRRDEIVYLSNIYTNLGVLYSKYYQDGPARDAYQKALAVYPGNAPAHNNLGTIYLEEGDYPRAFEEFQEARALEGKYTFSYYYNMGMLCFKLGEYPQAVELLQKSLTLQDDRGQAYYYLGFAYEKLGDRRRARENAERALELLPAAHDRELAGEAQRLLDRLAAPE